MKEKIKTLIAFTVLGITVAVSFMLNAMDKSTDVYPDEDTQIRLYGEAHGSKLYYDIEFEHWKECYDKGYRNLFVELPYFSAEFLNFWMQEDSDELLDIFFEEISDTLSGNPDSKAFYKRIKEECPETIFYGTDVGHQYQTTGPRFLQYLEDRGLKDSEIYELALENIAQGETFSAENSMDGISEFRESCMTSNFIAAYERCGGGKIMGIYGSFHTEPSDPWNMINRLKEYYGDSISFSSVKLSSLAFDEVCHGPYDLGFCITGLVFLIMLVVPNLIWAKMKPEGYEEAAGKENKVLLLLERIGEVLMTVILVIFPAFDLQARQLPEGIFFKFTIIIWFAAVVLMILYECYWIRYFVSKRTLKDMYRSFAGFPVAGASLPVIAAFLLGLYSGNLIMIAVSVILGIGHIGIHLNHKKEADAVQD